MTWRRWKALDGGRQESGGAAVGGSNLAKAEDVKTGKWTSGDKKVEARVVGDGV